MLIRCNPCKAPNLRLGLILIITIALSSCLGGGSGGTTTTGVSTSGAAPATSTSTAADVAAITPVQIATYSNAQIIALDVNIKYLSNAALGAFGTWNGQIGAITATQIAALTPAQVQLLGATASGTGGVYGPAQLVYLNTAAWGALAGAPLQVAAITAAEIPQLTNAQIVALGTNFNSLSNAALAALGAGSGQIGAITAAQIAVLTPAQVRLFGATASGTGGVYGPSQLVYLNAAAWGALASDPLQVAAITAAEIPQLTNLQIIALGTNIHSLSNEALAVLGAGSGQIGAITAAQIAALTPVQVRLLGAVASGSGGVNGPSQLVYLNTAAWGALAIAPLQVAAITAAEIPQLTNPQIIALGTNFNSLSNAALAALGTGQIGSITAAQISTLTPAQVSIIAGTHASMGIIYLNTGAFGSLSPSQIAVLTTAQKASMSVAQHTSCGC